MRVTSKGKTAEEKRLYYREYMRERRKAFKDSGKCVYCGKEVVKGHTLCEDCEIKQRNASYKYFKKKVFKNRQKAKEEKKLVEKKEKDIKMIEIISIRDMTPEEKEAYEKAHPIENIKKLDRLPIEIVAVRDLNS